MEQDTIPDQIKETKLRDDSIRDLQSCKAAIALPLLAVTGRHLSRSHIIAQCLGMLVWETIPGMEFGARVLT